MTKSQRQRSYGGQDIIRVKKNRWCGKVSFCSKLWRFLPTELVAKLPSQGNVGHRNVEILRPSIFSKLNTTLRVHGFERSASGESPSNQTDIKNLAPESDDNCIWFSKSTNRRELDVVRTYGSKKSTQAFKLELPCSKAYNELNGPKQIDSNGLDTPIQNKRSKETLHHNSESPEETIEFDSEIINLQPCSKGDSLSAHQEVYDRGSSKNIETTTTEKNQSTVHKKTAKFRLSSVSLKLEADPSVSVTNEIKKNICSGIPNDRYSVDKGFSADKNESITWNKKFLQSDKSHLLFRKQGFIHNSENIISEPSPISDFPIGLNKLESQTVCGYYDNDVGIGDIRNGAKIRTYESNFFHQTRKKLPNERIYVSHDIASRKKIGHSDRDISVANTRIKEKMCDEVELIKVSLEELNEDSKPTQLHQFSKISPSAQVREEKELKNNLKFKTETYSGYAEDYISDLEESATDPHHFDTNTSSLSFTTENKGNGETLIFDFERNKNIDSDKNVQSKLEIDPTVHSKRKHLVVKESISKKNAIADNCNAIALSRKECKHEEFRPLYVPIVQTEKKHSSTPASKPTYLYLPTVIDSSNRKEAKSRYEKRRYGTSTKLVTKCVDSRASKISNEMTLDSKPSFIEHVDELNITQPNHNTSLTMAKAFFDNLDAKQKLVIENVYHIEKKVEHGSSSKSFAEVPQSNLTSNEKAHFQGKRAFNASKLSLTKPVPLMGCSNIFKHMNPVNDSFSCASEASFDNVDIAQDLSRKSRKNLKFMTESHPEYAMDHVLDLEELSSDSYHFDARSYLLGLVDENKANSETQIFDFDRNKNLVFDKKIQSNIEIDPNLHLKRKHLLVEELASKENASSDNCNAISLSHEDCKHEISRSMHVPVLENEEKHTSTSVSKPKKTHLPTPDTCNAKIVKNRYEKRGYGTSSKFSSKPFDRNIPKLSHTLTLDSKPSLAESKEMAESFFDKLDAKQEVIENASTVEKKEEHLSYSKPSPEEHQSTLISSETSKFSLMESVSLLGSSENVKNTKPTDDPFTSAIDSSSIKVDIAQDFSKSHNTYDESIKKLPPIVPSSYTKYSVRRFHGKTYGNSSKLVTRNHLRNKKSVAINVKLSVEAENKETHSYKQPSHNTALLIAKSFFDNLDAKQKLVIEHINI